MFLTLQESTWYLSAQIQNSGQTCVLNTDVSHPQAGVKQIVLAVSYRAEQMERELKHVEEEVGILY